MGAASDIFSPVPQEVSMEYFHHLEEEIGKLTSKKTRISVRMNELKVSANEK